MTERGEGLVLVVDDDRPLGALLSLWLRRAGFQVETFYDAESALDALSRLLPDVVCLDLSLPGISGLAALEKIVQKNRILPVLILTADRGIDTVVSAMRLGAYNYVAKPVDETRLVTEVRNAVERHGMTLRLTHLEREVAGAGYAGIVGRSGAILELFRQMDRVAPSEITVLIHGESGTGKELVAKALHASSGRKDGPFVALNCAAIPESLQESELFGHEKGAFTSAIGRRAGRFEQASGGTLFLDEVAELSAGLQAKLLRAIQERSFFRVGGSVEVRSDFRLISATHTDLAQRVSAGGFRQDLYFRLAVFEMEIPPLRERREDIRLIAESILASLGRPDGTRLSLSDQAAQVMEEYAWPGNVRELENALQRAVVVCQGSALQVSDLPLRVRRHVEPEAGAAPAGPQLIGRSVARAPEPAPLPLPSATGSAGIHDLETVERRAIEEAVSRTSGNLSEASRRLGIGRGTLYRKMKRYGLLKSEG